MEKTDDGQVKGFKIGHNGGATEKCDCGWARYRYTKDGCTVEYCLNRWCPHYIGNHAGLPRKPVLPPGATLHRN